MVHRHPHKARPTLRTLEKATNDPLLANKPEKVHTPDPYSPSNSKSNTNSSGKSSGPTNNTYTTGQTSLDSKFSKLSSSKETYSGDRKPKTATIICRQDNEPDVDPSLDAVLEPIDETALDLPSPSILTVEKAAAAKIYLETHFNNLLSKPSPRDMRHQYLESELYHSPGLTPAEKQERRRVFYKRESDHLRETRTLKARSIGAMRGTHNSLVDNYEVLKILGKGSFGVVRLVREKSNGHRVSQLADQQRPVFAMKVIRKSTMLKTSQEGHLRAERDCLVSSEDSRWYTPPLSQLHELIQ